MSQPPPPRSAASSEPEDPSTHDRAILARPQRLSVLGIVVYAWEGIRRIGNVGLVFAILAVLSNYIWIVGVLAVLAISYGLVTWSRFLFHVNDSDELVVTSGVFGRRHVSIPLERVSAITMTQDLAHRVLRLVALEIETAGSATTEIELVAVPRPIGEALGRVCADEVKADQAAKEPKDTPSTRGDSQIPSTRVESAKPSTRVESAIIAHRTPGELLLIGLTSPVDLGPLGIAGLVAAAVSQLAELFGVATEGIERDLIRWVGSRNNLAMAVALLLVTLFVIRITRTIGTLYGFTIWRSRAGLRTSAGLLRKEERAAPYERIQTCVRKQNPMQRRYSFSMLIFKTPSGGANSFARTSVIVPGTTPPEEAELMRLITVGDPLAMSRPFRIASYARRRWVLFGAAWTFGPILVAVAVISWLLRLDGQPTLLEHYGLGAFLGAAVMVIIVIVMLAQWRFASWRWAVDDEFLSAERRWFTTTTTGMSVRKVQSVSWQQSWGQRRAGVATVRIYTAADHLEVPHVEVSQASWLRDVLIYRAETDPRPAL